MSKRECSVDMHVRGTGACKSWIRILAHGTPQNVPKDASLHLTSCCVFICSPDKIYMTYSLKSVLNAELKKTLRIQKEDIPRLSHPPDPFISRDCSVPALERAVSCPFRVI